MKISIDICTVTGADGKKGLRVWPEIEGTNIHKIVATSVFLSILTALSLWAISITPDPNIKPDQTVVLYQSR